LTHACAPALSKIANQYNSLRGSLRVGEPMRRVAGNLFLTAKVKVPANGMVEIFAD
jgi:hypothetical protein